MTLQRQTSLFTEDRLTSSQGDSLANPTQWQESEKEKKMNAIYGPKCLDAYEKFNRHGSWAKMFSGLLIGMKGWSSKRCRLIWKLKGTQYNRMYFQLHPLTHHTEGTGFGLLLTPTTRKEVQDLQKFKARMEKYPNGTTMPNLATQVFNGFLPTPLASAREQTNFEAYDQRMKRLEEKGHKPFTMPLDQMALRGLLPTPVASDKNAGRRGNAPREGHNPMTNSLKDAMNFIEQTSKCSQLAPQFVLEMMGFPTDWTLLPFLNGEQNQSKQEGTQ